MVEIGEGVDLTEEGRSDKDKRLIRRTLKRWMDTLLKLPSDDVRYDVMVNIVGWYYSDESPEALVQFMRHVQRTIDGNNLAQRKLGLKQ